MDAWQLDQLRESRWDRWLSRRPRCDVCGQPITENSMLVLEGLRCCQRCLQRGMVEIEES